jgi:hypothetical protein
LREEKFAECRGCRFQASVPALDLVPRGKSLGEIQADETNGKQRSSSIALGPLVAVGGDYAGASVSRVTMHYVIGQDTTEALRWAEGLPNSDSAVYAKPAAFIGSLPT